MSVCAINCDFFFPWQVQSLCKMAGGTKRALWQPHVTQAGRTRRRQVACGTPPAPKEAAHLGDREATGAGVRATLGRSPATRWVPGGENDY